MSAMFEGIFGKKEENADDKQVSKEELTALGINIPMSRGELNSHLAMEDRKKALGEKMSEKETPLMTDEDRERLESALAKSQEAGGK